MATDSDLQTLFPSFKRSDILLTPFLFVQNQERERGIWAFVKTELLPWHHSSPAKRTSEHGFLDYMVEDISRAMAAVRILSFLYEGSPFGFRLHVAT